MGSGNWIVDNLNSALQTWNDKLAEIWTLISTTPEEFKGGGIWNVIVSINILQWTLLVHYDKCQETKSR